MDAMVANSVGRFSRPVASCGGSPHCQHRNLRARHQPFRYGTEQRMGDSGQPPSCNHDHVLLCSSA